MALRHQPEARVGRRLPVALALAVAVVGFLADRTTKAWALSSLTPGVSRRAWGGAVSWLLVFNPGAAFSMGPGATVGLSVFAMVALLGLLWWTITRAGTRATALAAGCAMAGIAGNLVDRLTRPPGPLRGHVVDFVALPRFPKPLRLGGYVLDGWPIFNVADALLCTAVGIMVILSLRPAPTEPLGPQARRADHHAAPREVDEVHEHEGPQRTSPVQADLP